MEMVADRVGINVGSRALLGPQATGKIAKVVDQQRNVSIQCFADTLAIFPGFNIGQRFQVGLQPICDLQLDN